MGNSPDTVKKGDSKSPIQTNNEPSQTSDADPKAENAVKPDPANAEPLAPPPRPAQPAVSNTPDYFSGNHGLSNEANPFEFSFGGGAPNGGQVQTPGGTKLPSVAALTSPAGSLLGTSPNFWGGLRSGPLSPAMLSGPQKEDYFSDGHHLRGGFPTPNESGLRSGLTPGGGGSMFPEPSPQSQALFNSLASGGATPTTLDFHRTAMNAAAATNAKREAPQPNITSQPPQELLAGMDTKPPTQGHFDQHDANDAANGLFLLAQARNGPQPTNHYTMAPQMPVHAHPQTMQMGGQSTETSPTMANRNGGSMSTASGRGGSEMSGFSDENDQQARPNTRGKGKRNSTQEATPTNGRRKATDGPAKGPAAKKSKANNGNSMGMDMEPPSDEEVEENKGDEYHANGKKMTDEEKRKNFLERNRVAALKCRQRKKQWLANLQQKVEIYTAENDNLNAQLSAVREELVNLKTILVAHKDCPVSQQQGISGMGMHQMLEGNFSSQMSNPYGLAMSGQHQHQQVMAGQGMQRRYS